MIGTFIQQLRKKHNFTQEYLSSQLKISRPTYVQIEQNERDVTISEAKKLATLFAVPLMDFLEGNNPKEYTVVLEKEKKEDAKKREMRINVPQKNVKKFKEVLLYILDKVGARPHIGETAIEKLLYFIDFDYYEKYEEQLMGATYIKNHHGPTPVEFKKIVEEMEQQKDLEKVQSKYFQYDQKKYLPRRQANLSNLTAQELEVINAVIQRLGNKCATELREYSHHDVPWMTAQDGKPIEYESVFYRTEPYSVRRYDDTL